MKHRECWQAHKPILEFQVDNNKRVDPNEEELIENLLIIICTFNLPPPSLPH